MFIKLMEGHLELLHDNKMIEMKAYDEKDIKFSLKINQF